MSNIIDTDLFYYLVNNNPALTHPRYLDAEQPTNNNVYVNDNLLNNPNQKWAFEPTGETDEYYLVNHNPALTHPRYLDAEQPTNNNVYANDSLLKNSNQKWKLKPTGKVDEYYIVNNNPVLNHPRYLYASQPTGNNVYACDNLSEISNEKWTLQVAGIKSKITFIEMDYEDVQYPKAGLGKVDFINDQEFINNGDVEITKTFSKTIHESSTFEWGLKETLMVGASIEFQAKVPFINSGAKATLKTELTLESHQKWSKTKSEEYKYQDTIKVNPFTKVAVTGYMDWAENYETPYTLAVKVEMLADTLSGNEKTLSSADIEKVLKLMGCDGKIIPNIDGQSVNVELKGAFSGTYGMKTHTFVEKINS